MWLGQHLERVHARISSLPMEPVKQFAGHVALMRGLLSFISPEIICKSEEGLAWLEKAVHLRTPQAITIYSRLASISEDFTLKQDLISQLQEEAKTGSLFAQEDLLNYGIHVVDNFEEDMSKVVGSVTQNSEEHLIRPLHYIAFLRNKEDIQHLADKSVEEAWNIEAQCLVGVDVVTEGRLNYAMTQPGTALHWAVAMNNLTAVKALVGVGANPYTMNIGGNTPWALAVSSRLLPIIQFFADSCPCENEKIRAESTKQVIYCTSLHVYLACGKQFVERSLDVFKYLCEIGALARKEAYLSTVSVGPESPKLLKQLLEVDYTLSPDVSILEEVLLHAVQFSNEASIEIVLERFSKFKMTDYTILILCSAIDSTQAASLSSFRRLLDHLDSDFDINVRFTHQHVRETGRPMISTIEGVTMLHFAFSRGKTSMAIELLSRGANPTVLSLGPKSEMSGATPLGHLLFSQTHHNSLALCEFLRSKYLKDNPTFILDNAILNPNRRQNIFHFICSGEDERVHNGTGHKVAALYDLLDHLQSINEVGAREKVIELLNARLIDNDEEGQTPLLIAVSSGFSQAISPLVHAGARPLKLVGENKSTQTRGISILHMADFRSSLVWKEEFRDKYRRLRVMGFPWIDINSPVASKMRADYEERTWECISEIRDVLLQSLEGRTLWNRRKAAREADGLRVE